MTSKDDITRMARQAGIAHHGLGWTCWEGQLERFFNAAYAAGAAAEREAIAKWMIDRGYATGHGDTIEDLLKELEWQIAENWTNALVKGVEGEREACAQLCERMARRTEDIRMAALEMAADAIRARGQA